MHDVRPADALVGRLTTRSLLLVFLACSYISSFLFSLFVFLSFPSLTLASFSWSLWLLLSTRLPVFPVLTVVLTFSRCAFGVSILCVHLSLSLSRCRLDELTDQGQADFRLSTGLTNRSIFIGSLEAGVKTGVHSVYGTSGDTHVRFHVFETNNDTVDDFGCREHKEKALVDLWLMSYAQTLIVSPTSTYGHVAMALGNTETWVLDKEPLDGCSKARSQEPCFQVIPYSLYDYEVAGKAKPDERLGFYRSLFGVVSKCNDQYGGLTFVTT